ncbi:BTAD domain-containing putative transcriptional regulator [Nonomuraea candida]|uniref:BTAD domain-containing putative transcriptional regulator n=1 Tax=Nonomuraea candida TaxID=359159 RepID=UPI000AF3E9A6|nr:BTAD domain-containing putative transcriptional regulator [Nonomuraea candida]
MLLARLALAGGRPVSAEALIDDLWGEEAPSGASAALQGLVSRLRRALRGAATVELVAGGYRLPIGPDDVDVHRFEELAGRGRRELAAGRHHEAAELLGAALALWRGEALADVLEAPFARTTATKLDEVRAAAREDWFEAELRRGRHAEVLAELGTAAAAQPLRERLAELRMRALSAAGRQSDALAVYEELRERLADELGVDPAPELRAVHLALLRGELDHPVAASGSEPNRLPARLTSFVGREKELDQLRILLAGSRLVSIVGPGGAGKTRLSLEAADRQGGRVWFVPLAGLTRPDDLAEAVLGAVGGRSGGRQPGEPVDRLVDRLDVGEAVLLLDNCEHLVDAVAELADTLLARLPRLRILATSREPLAITGEALCLLGPLELPEEGASPSEAARAAAVRLFVERATSVKPDFAADASTPEAAPGPVLESVVEICRRLDGLPLALELAAARLRTMGVDQIARRLDDRFRLLTSGSRTALPRQRTLLAVVEWSWDLLSERERALARRLSIFPGGADLAAVEAVCADDPPPPTGAASDERAPAREGGPLSAPAGEGGSPGERVLAREDVLEVIGSLIEKSIVQQAGGRYRMLETIRAYAADRLAAAGEDVSARFGEHFLALAERHEPLLRTRDQLRALELFDTEHENLALGLSLALDAADVRTASRFVRAMFWYWGLRGMTTPYVAAMAGVLAFGDALPPQERAAFAVMRGAAGALRPGSDADPGASTAFHPALPMLLMAQLAEPQDQERHLRETMASPDPWVRASTLITLDEVRAEQGDLLTGAPGRHEALRGFEAVGDRWGLVMCLLRISREHSLRAEHERSVAVAERAVAVAAELGTELHLCWTRGRLARERMNGGDLAGAVRDLRAALGRAEAAGHRRTQANMWALLSVAHRLAGKTEQAERALDRLEELTARLPSGEGLPGDLIAGFRMAGRLAEGAAEAARALLPRVVPALSAFGQAGDLAWGAELTAMLLHLEGDPDGAAEWLGLSQVIRGAFDQGDPELRELVSALTGKLGEEGYRAAYGRGAAVPRQEALRRLADQAG